MFNLSSSLLYVPTACLRTYICISLSLLTWSKRKWDTDKSKARQTIVSEQDLFSLLPKCDILFLMRYRKNSVKLDAAYKAVQYYEKQKNTKISGVSPWKEEDCSVWRSACLLPIQRGTKVLIAHCLLFNLSHAHRNMLFC